jgi:hypothetical protein
MNKSGSIFLLILFTMTALLIFATTAWRSAYFALQSIYMRQESIKQRYALQALVLYAIAYVKMNARTLMTEAKNVTLSFDTWPVQSPDIYKPYQEATIELCTRKNAVFVSAHVKDGGQILKDKCIIDITEHEGKMNFMTRTWQ